MMLMHDAPDYSPARAVGAAFQSSSYPSATPGYGHIALDVAGMSVNEGRPEGLDRRSSDANDPERTFVGQN
jgi:hypothetical protein